MYSEIFDDYWAALPSISTPLVTTAFASSILAASWAYIKLNQKIQEIRRSAPVYYRDTPFLEFVSGLVNRNVPVKVTGLKDKIQKRGRLLICNHIDILDGIAVVKAIADRVVFVITTEFNMIPGLGSFLTSLDTIFVESDPRRDRVKSAEDIIKAISEKIAAGYTVAIFPSGSLDFYKRSPDLERTIKSGAARAIMKLISDKHLDIDVVIINKSGVSDEFSGSMLGAIPSFFKGHFNNVTMSIDAIIPLEILSRKLSASKWHSNPEIAIKIVTALYAGFMSTRFLSSPDGSRQLKIKPIILTPEQKVFLDEIKDDLFSRKLAIRTAENSTPAFVRRPLRTMSSQAIRYLSVQEESESINNELIETEMKTTQEMGLNSYITISSP